MALWVSPGQDRRKLPLLSLSLPCQGVDGSVEGVWQGVELLVTSMTMWMTMMMMILKVEPVGLAIFALVKIRMYECS